MKTLMFLFAITLHILFASSATENNPSLYCQKWSHSHLKWAIMYSHVNTTIAYIQFETIQHLNVSCNHLFDQHLYILIFKSTSKHFLLDYIYARCSIRLASTA